MNIRELMEGIECRVTGGNGREQIRGIAYDSRNVHEGYVFFAVDGFKTKGIDFVQSAVERGAVAVVSRYDPLKVRPSVVWVKVGDSRKALSRASANFYNHPTKKLLVVGITGTSGKTTVSYLVHSVLMSAGVPSGLIGTIEVSYGDVRRRSRLTTPESSDIHAIASQMVEKGLHALVMEVSSHSLKLHRVDDVEFDVAVFTNIGRDHLDFHLSTDDYIRSKSILFNRLLRKGDGRGCIANGSDRWLERVTGCYRGKRILFSLWRSSNIDLFPLHYTSDLSGIRGEIRTPAGNISFKSSLIGKHNLMNIMAAMGVGVCRKISPEEISVGIRKIEVVPGRMERIVAKGGRTVIIDYSHTPDSLKSALESISELSGGRVITVFGAGGDRDRDKRAEMGRVSTLKSTCVVVTSDNPRSENPEKIIDMIVDGVRDGGFVESKDRLVEGGYSVIVDRKDAIDFAIRNSANSDIILIAGKGHEDYQIFSDRTVHFSDREEVFASLKRHKLI